MRRFAPKILLFVAGILFSGVLTMLGVTPETLIRWLFGEAWVQWFHKEAPIYLTHNIARWVFVGLGVLLFLSVTTYPKLTRRKLKILFGHGGSFMMSYLDPDSASANEFRLYRVMVMNESSKTINNIRLQLERIYKYSSQFLPIELLQMHDMHDHSTLPARTFNLAPKESKYIDVVVKEEGNPRSKYPIVLQYAIPYLANTIPGKRYELTLSVYGDGTRPDKKTFVVDVDVGSTLLFYIRKRFLPNWLERRKSTLKNRGARRNGN